jgi:hypothetical protein
VETLGKEGENPYLLFLILILLLAANGSFERAVMLLQEAREAKTKENLAEELHSWGPFPGVKRVPKPAVNLGSILPLGALSYHPRFRFRHKMLK